MRPLRFVIIHHVGDFRQQQAVRFQDALCLLQKWRIEIAQIPVLLFPTLDGRTEVHVKTLLALVAALRSNVRRVVDDSAIFFRWHARHLAVVSDDHRLVLRINIHRNYTTLRAFPETPGVIRRVQNWFGRDGRIKLEHRLEQIAIAGFPNAAEGRVRRAVAVRRHNYLKGHGNSFRP